MQTDLMHGSILVVGQVQPLGPWRSCPGGRGVGDQDNIFSLILRSTYYFSHGLHDGCGTQDYIFLRKKAGICRRVVGEEYLFKSKVCI